MAWSGSITTPAAGQSLWAIDGTYNPNTNQTSWSSPYLTQGFPTTIQSDNYVLNTSGWQIQRDTGNAYFNAISARGDISGASNLNITGQAKFNGQNNSSFTIPTFGSVYYSAFGITPTSPPVSGVLDSGVLGVASSIGASYNIGITGYGVNNGLGVFGYGDNYGGYFAGGTYALYANGPIATSSTALVTNLYSQYTFYLKGQGSGASNLYFQTGPTTGASVASFTATNKPGTTSGSNTWIEVIIGGVSYQIPVWAS